MPTTTASVEIDQELQLAEAQAAELWRQAEQVCAAYRAAR